MKWTSYCVEEEECDHPHCCRIVDIISTLVYYVSVNTEAYNWLIMMRQAELIGCRFVASSASFICCFFTSNVNMPLGTQKTFWINWYFKNGSNSRKSQFAQHKVINFCVSVTRFKIMHNCNRILFVYNAVMWWLSVLDSFITLQLPR